MAGSIIQYGYQDDGRITLFGIDDEGNMVEVGWDESIYAEIKAVEANHHEPLPVPDEGVTEPTDEPIDGGDAEGPEE